MNKEYTKALYESFGDFYQEGIEMPEPPKQGFFKGFFGGGAKPLDREELFGGSNASSTIAVKTEGAKMTAAQANAAAGGSEIAKAKEAVCERGNKLNEVEEKTEQMANDAKIWADTSKQLLDKYKNKKWYQLWGWSHPTKVEDHLNVVEIATRDTADITFLTWYIPIIKDLALGGDFHRLLTYDSERESNYNKFINESKFDIMKQTSEY